MPAENTCGDIPTNQAIAIPLGADLGISLTLVRSAAGYCFSDWSRHDQRAVPAVSDADKARIFPTADGAVTFFRDLFQSFAD